MAKVLCIGDLMLDVICIIPNVPAELMVGNDNVSKISTHGGGAAGNVASWLAKSGADVQIVGRVGHDSAGAALVAELNELGVAHDNLHVEGVNTGVVVVLVDPSGERTMLAETGANSGLTLNDLPSLEGFDAVYLSGYAPLDLKSRPAIMEMIARINQAGIPIFYDPATVGGMIGVPLEEIRSWIDKFYGILLNEEEAIFLSGHSNAEDALNHFLEFCELAVIKRGSHGAIGKMRGGEMISIDAEPTTVIDTTGAGDSFAGGFIASFAKNQNLQEAMALGTHIAARCVAIVGARPQVDTAI